MSSIIPVVDAQRVAAALAAFGHSVESLAAPASSSRDDDQYESADDGVDDDMHEVEGVEADDYDDNASESGAVGDFDINLAPRSPPYLRDFETRISFLGDTIVQQYNRFMQLWLKYMRDNRLPVTGYDTRRIATTDVVLNPFEVFRAVVQRGGYFRCFMLNPVNREFPPFDRETGQPLYVIPRQERPFEIGETFSSSDPAGQLPAEGEWERKVYFMRDGLFLRNAMYLRNVKVYYERYLLGFENAYCWKNSMAKRPIYDPKAKANGQCKYDFSECVFEEIELPEQFRPSTRELRRIYTQYANHPYRTKGAEFAQAAHQGEGAQGSDARFVLARTAAVANSGSAKTASLHFRGMYSMARTMQACFLSNPLRINQSLLVELTHAMNYLMALSKQFATKMSDEAERKLIEQKFESMHVAAVAAAAHVKPDSIDASSNVIVASHSLASLLPSASPNWYFDVLLLFENDIFSHLFDQLLHPRSIALRLKTMQRLEELGHSIQPDAFAAQVDNQQAARPLPPHIPQYFTSSTSFFHLAPAAQKFFFETLMQNLNNLSYPNLTIAVLTILQNFTFPTSLLQKCTEKHLNDAANAGKKKEKEKEELSGEHSLFIATVRTNLLKHPLLLDTLFDYIDTTSDSYPLSIQLNGNDNNVDSGDVADDDLDPDRFDIIDVPAVDNIVELRSYLDTHGADAKPREDDESDEVEHKQSAMDDVTIVSTANASSVAPAASTGNAVKLPATVSSNRVSVQAGDSMDIDSDNAAASSSARIDSERGLLPPQYLHLSPYLLVDDCRYLSLQILSNLVMDIPWLSSDFQHQYEANNRNKLFWIEMAKEMQAYDMYVLNQTNAFATSPQSQQQQSLSAPPFVALEFIMSSFQLLLSMLHSEKGPSILDAMLPYQQGEKSSARAVLQSQQLPDFYQALMGIALTPHVQPQMNLETKSSKSSSAMTWHERVQMTALETVAQFLLISPASGGLFLRDKLLLSKLVRLMQAWGDVEVDGSVVNDNRSKRFRRTIAFVISALLTYVMNWESKQAKAQGVASSNALLLSMANPHLGPMFAVCAYDPDVSVLLSRWTSYCAKLQQNPASRAPATPSA